MANPFDVDVPDIGQALLGYQTSYKAAQDGQKQQLLADARATAAQQYAQGNIKGAQQTLLGMGDFPGVNSVSGIQNHADTLAQQAIDNSRNSSNDLFSHNLQTKQLAISQQNADRLNTTPLETANQRAAAATQYGIQPGTPEFKSFVLEGKLPDSITKGPDGNIKTLTPGGELYHVEDGKVVVDHKNDKSASADDIPQSTVDFLADRTRLGDKTHLVGLARVPGLIARVQTAADQRESAGLPISDQAKAVVNNQVTLGARGSAERKLGGITTNNEFFGNNALGAMDIAERASAAVPRTNYPSVNAAINAYNTNTGDPATVALGGALNTVVNDYAKFTGGGVGTDALRGEAMRMLNSAHSHQQVQAVLNMMRTEIARGQQSPGMVRGTFDQTYAPSGSGAPARPPEAAAVPSSQPSPAAPNIPPPPKPGQLVDGYRFKGGNPADPNNWFQSK